jgi:lipopolysaccharide export system permease protein
MNHLFYLARLVIGQGIAVQTALILMIYKIPYFIAFSVPMGVLLATVLGIGRLTDHSEIAALRVAGISLYRIAVPVVLAGAVATLGALIFSEGVVSLSDEQYRNVFNDVMSHGPDLRPVDNVFFQAPTTGGNALYSAHQYDPRTRTLLGVTVVYLNAGQPLEIIEAQTATYRRGVEWTFHLGRVYAFQGGNVVTTAFDTLAVTVPRSPQEFSVAPQQPSDMSMRELSRQIATLHREGADARAFVGELNSRFATAVSCIVSEYGAWAEHPRADGLLRDRDPGPARLGRAVAVSHRGGLAPRRRRVRRRGDPAGAGRQVSAPEGASPLPQRRELLLLVLVLLFAAGLFTFRLGAGSLWDLDEPRYAQASREILATGDPLTMHLDGNTWFGPPPLWMWLQAGTGWVFGFTEFTARVWAAAFGVLEISTPRRSLPANSPRVRDCVRESHSHRPHNQ